MKYSNKVLLHKLQKYTWKGQKALLVELLTLTVFIHKGIVSSVDLKLQALCNKFRLCLIYHRMNTQQTCNLL